METRDIDDYIALGLPDGAGPPDDPALIEHINQLAESMLYAQYGEARPRLILFDPVDWLITGDPLAVERHQPAHDCETCRQGNIDARRYLEANPGRRLALGNIHYVEIW